MIRLAALVVITVAVLAVAWYVAQTDSGSGVLVVVFGGLFFVAPALFAVIDNERR